MITVQDLVALRKSLDLSQAEMAAEMGLSPRAYQAIEMGESTFRKLHALAAERVSLDWAVSDGRIEIALPLVRAQALELARMITKG